MNTISEERLEACRAYVQSVLASGDDISIILHPAWFKRNGRFKHDIGDAAIHYHLGRKGDAPPRSRSRDVDFSIEEFVAVLEPLGKVHDWREKMPWHFGDGLFVDWRPFGEIIGGRLKEAREALGMDVATFYAPAGMTEKTAKKWEAGQIASRFQAFGERRFKALSEAHRIPEQWLLGFDQLSKRCKERSKASASETNGVSAHA